MRLSLLLLLVLAGCATPPDQPPPAPEAPPPAEAPQKRESVAVAGLMERARADTSAGRLSNAAASLERALRIEPRNPRLWHELGKVRLKQGQYAQAESMAARSNSWAGSDSVLREENQRLIEQAREAAGR
jgi:Tfp pilus assembly protein PilF